MTALTWIDANADRLRAEGPWFVDGEGRIRAPASEERRFHACPLSAPSAVGAPGMDAPAMAARHGIDAASAYLIIDAADANPGHWRDIREALLRAVGLTAPEPEARR